jgi:hypothetical protein
VATSTPKKASSLRTPRRSSSSSANVSKPAGTICLLARYISMRIAAGARRCCSCGATAAGMSFVQLPMQANSLHTAACKCCTHAACKCCTHAALPEAADRQLMRPAARACAQGRPRRRTCDDHARPYRDVACGEQLYRDRGADDFLDVAADDRRLRHQPQHRARHLRTRIALTLQLSKQAVYASTASATARFAASARRLCARAWSVVRSRSSLAPEQPEVRWRSTAPRGRASCCGVPRPASTADHPRRRQCCACCAHHARAGHLSGKALTQVRICSRTQCWRSATARTAG